MKITKYGHCCLLIEDNGTRIITDPGIFTTEQNDAMNVNAIVITHDHGDHFHIESIKKIREKNPDVIIVSNHDVGALLEKEHIPYVKVEDDEETIIGSMRIAGKGKDHAVLIPGMQLTMNTGYFIGDRIFYPGDAFIEPEKPIDVLALPVAGPWMKLSEAIEYVQKVKPSIAFPVHDGVLKNPGMMTPWLQQIFEKMNVRYVALPLNEETEI